MKERITQLKDLDSVDLSQLSTAKKINSQIYPGKTGAEIKAHLESIQELEIGATHTHALLSACEVKCAPGVQDGCRKRISWQRRGRCRSSWCSLGEIGDVEAVITLVAVSGLLCIGSSSRGRCNIDRVGG